MSKQPYGTVYLVGAGPGDPGLITVRGRALLEQADVVIYDALCHPALLENAPQAEHIYVGKQTDQHSLPQEEIGRVLITQAQQHSRVVRLKGGDPFVFGRGGEEGLVLKEAGIPFEVVPGVTAGVGASAYAGIPLTHRGYTGSVTFITGHRAKGEDQLSLSLRNLGQEGTLVFYMGVKTLPTIVEELIHLGRGATTPIAVIEWGTYARQRTMTATLETICDAVEQAAIQAPALIVVGEVVELREALSWYEQRPLFGLRVALTHAAKRGATMETRLRELGAEVLRCPTVAFEAPDTDSSPLDFESADWLLLTSVNSVTMVFDALKAQGKDSRALAGIRCCAVGRSTIDALRCRSIEPEVTPTRMEASAVVEAMNSHNNLEKNTVLFPRSDIARTALVQQLEDAGATVNEVVAYAAQVPDAADAYIEALAGFNPDLVVFTNSAAVRHFAQLTESLEQDVIRPCIYASIGPVTSLAAQEAGLEISVEPAQHDIQHLLEAICRWRNR